MVVSGQEGSGYSQRHNDIMPLFEVRNGLIVSLHYRNVGSGIQAVAKSQDGAHYVTISPCRIASTHCEHVGAGSRPVSKMIHCRYRE